jgi:hypothetical protein
VKKNECTVEEWDAVRAYQRDYYRKNAEKVREQRRQQYQRRIDKEHARAAKYNRRPEIVARRRVWDAKPENVLRRRSYAQTEEAKVRAKERMEERYRADPLLKHHRSSHWRWKRLGFTRELIHELLALQNNRCAVCQNLFSETNRFHADHSHETGKARGLLCFQCNIIDGKLRRIGVDPIEFGKRLHNYLENPLAERCKSFS